MDHGADTLHVKVLDTYTQIRLAITIISYPLFKSAPLVTLWYIGSQITAMELRKKKKKKKAVTNSARHAWAATMARQAHDLQYADEVLAEYNITPISMPTHPYFL